MARTVRAQRGGVTWMAVGAVAALLLFALYDKVTTDQPRMFTALDKVNAEVLVPSEALTPLLDAVAESKRDRASNYLGTDLVVTADHRVLFTVSDALLELRGWENGTLEVAKLLDGAKIRHFTADENGTIWAIGDEGMGWVENGGFHVVLPMQATNFDGLAVSNARRTVYMHNGGSIIAVSERADPKYLWRSSKIVGICPTSRGLIVATSSEILFLAGNSVSLIARARKTDIEIRSWTPGIISIAYSPSSNTVFYSTLENVYAVKGFDSMPLTSNLGGALTYFDGKLYVLDKDKGALVRLSNVDQL